MVAESYGEIVAVPADGGCCGAKPASKGAVVDLAGYASDDLAALPANAVVNSFGCGDPVAFAELQLGDVVLDLGSGAGIDLFLAAKKVGPGGRVIGVDMTDEMIARANENIATGGYTNVEELPIEDASIDWVISNCVINLSPEKPRVFAEIARVLKPGGKMLVSDIVAEDLPDELRAIPAFYASCLGGAIGEEEYLAGLRAAGLVDTEVRGRLVYDAEQLVGAGQSVIDDPDQLLAVASAAPRDQPRGCCGEVSLPVLDYVRTLEGKVWSAKIFARKGPAAREILTEQEKELIAVGASIAAGCRPCTSHHVAAAQGAGASEGEIRAAVDAALGVRDSARKGMAAFADGLLGAAGGCGCADCGSARSLLDELVSFAAACAVNSVVDLESHLAHARTAGATAAQIKMALSISRMVSRVAAEKIELALDGSEDDDGGTSACSLLADVEAGEAPVCCG
jgi:AhpD family alkylhydroperoxidase